MTNLHGKGEMNKAPRVLVYDIETSHNIVAQFDPKDQYTQHHNILVERFIICAAWRWLGEKTVHTVQIDKPFDDYKVVKKLHEVMSEADCVVAHFGDRFDKP